MIDQLELTKWGKLYQGVAILEEVLDPQLDRVHAQLVGQVVHDAFDDVVTLDLKKPLH